MIQEVDLSVIYLSWHEQPEFTPPPFKEIEHRCSQQYLALVYRQENTQAGFKLGYAMNENTFYSWVGGVKPQYRGQGIAKAMLIYQENWCRQHNFREIRVKSMNKFKPMLHMLLSHGYDIINLEHKESVDNAKIVFAKSLI